MYIHIIYCQLTHFVFRLVLHSLKVYSCQFIFYKNNEKLRIEIKYSKRQRKNWQGEGKNKGKSWEKRKKKIRQKTKKKAREKVREKVKEKRRERVSSLKKIQHHWYTDCGYSDCN